MRRLSLSLFFIVLFLGLAFASPVEERDLLKREYIGLWNESGPVVTDVKQVKIFNCWWAACSLAVLISSQNWIESMIRYGNNASMVNASWPQDGSVQVQIWNPDTLTPVIETAVVANKSQTEDHVDGNWWHDSLSQSIKLLGTKMDVAGIFPNGTFDPTSGSALTGLRVLTGFETASNLTSDYADADAFWTDLARANESTPVIFNTVSLDSIGVTDPQLGDSHDYAVFNGTVHEDGSKTVWARNSWGSTDEFKLEDVYNNTYQIIHLANWDRLEWQDSVNWTLT
ncbi:hypothetical protein L202_02126 [Cryptococcus amylolentus CBS 6039]|uniref:Calpain catalytic domain-containing protein n=1 Tax=Cryptococcus amylolentus CBS 6039 TaxID=1295533 RepID=A0A1E3I084_9TREE|nr:hypothetical protein L202_02126 [Cryptococcus amylolentus CBS 6039]ODN81735.1 hypothetical protein L202_02126 [Cryptococcus amylolentus CBS 6039]